MKDLINGFENKNGILNFILIHILCLFYKNKNKKRIKNENKIVLFLIIYYHKIDK